MENSRNKQVLILNGTPEKCDKLSHYSITLSQVFSLIINYVYLLYAYMYAEEETIGKI